jgi:N-acetylglutamate synthase-like GNAT family acetyltransferase
LTLRRGVQSDADAIRAGVLRESMNPLGLDPTRFVVAVDDARGGEIVGFGQLKPWETLSDRPKDDVVGQLVRLMNLTPNWSGELLELASLVVTKERRGGGVGTAVARRLVTDAKTAKAKPPTLCLLTLRTTIPFYERLGFEEIVSPEYVPRPLQAELALGRVVARLARNDECVAMKMDWEKSL